MSPVMSQKKSQTGSTESRRAILQMLLRTLLQKRFPGIPIQKCQFHQLQTITQKLTRNPKLLAGKELRTLALTLTKTTRQKFTAALDEWDERWG